MRLMDFSTLKAVSLNEAGRLRKFEMNSKCAAGTGRFLEIMAMALGYSLPDLGRAAPFGCQG